MANPMKIKTSSGDWVDVASEVTDVTKYAYLPTTPVSGFRNKLINGDFRIDQRYNGAALTTISSSLIYTADRWYAFCDGIGVNITGQRIAGTSPLLFNYRLSGPGGSSTANFGFGQRIESANSFDMAGDTATLSAFIAASNLTSITWSAYYANSTDSFGTVASPTRTLIATGTFTINSTLTRYSATMSIPSAATTGIEIVFTGGTLAAGQTVTFDNIQFEKGSIATPFEQRPIGTELNLCQRYYQLLFRSGYRRYVSNVDRNPMSFPVIMRATPTLIKSVTGSSNLQTDSTGTGNNYSYTIDVQYTSGGTGVIDIGTYEVLAVAEL